MSDVFSRIDETLEIYIDGELEVIKSTMGMVLTGIKNKSGKSSYVGKFMYNADRGTLTLPLMKQVR